MSIFEVVDHFALRHDLSAHLYLPTRVCACVCVNVSVWKGKEAQHDDTVKCGTSPHSWQIIRHAFRATFFRQMQKQGRFTLRVNVIIGTVWLRNQIRTRHRTGCMVMVESVVARACETGESIPGKVCCSILVTLHCNVSERALKVPLCFIINNNLITYTVWCILILIFFNFNLLSSTFKLVIYEKRDIFCNILCKVAKHQVSYWLH